MRLGLTAACVLACSFLLTGSGLASSTKPVKLTAPTQLHGFSYRADDPVPANHTYSQTPAFAWTAVKQATGYEIQLATGQSFSDATLLLDDTTVKTPVTSLQEQLPWMTGNPYALWARVRATSGSTVSQWSKPFGFNTSWQVPQQLSAPTGLVRWTPVPGATAYQVWFTDSGVKFTFETLTNVADEREYWTLHPSNAATIHWRVRAIRYVQNTSLPNKISVVSYGQYSPLFTSTNPTTIAASALKGTDAVSTVDSTPASPQADALMPGFAWSGSTLGDGTSGSGLWRVYVFSDSSCTNTVTIGSIVGGPAWAPRLGETAQLQLPTDVTSLNNFETGKTLPTWGAQTSAQMADGTKISTAEEASGTSTSSGTSNGPGTTTTSTTTTTTATTTTATTTTSSGPTPTPSLDTADPGLIELPDNGWPSGRYWWTVVPVGVYYARGSTTSLVYQDMELPQDACRENGVWSFGMQSMPVTTDQADPYASGLQSGKVVSAVSPQPRFEQLPVVTWGPVYGAQTYEIELSRKRYPWNAQITQTSVVPSVTLNLTAADSGLWYYRVRGVNNNLPGTAIKMTWSAPTAIRITGSIFKVVK